MLDTFEGMSALTLVEIIGPALLAIALIYGIYHSRRSRGLRETPRSGTIYAQDQD